MTLNEFYKKYNGKNVDVDNYAGAQCVDLIKVYFRDVLKVPVKAYGNACHYWSNFEKYPELTSNFEKLRVHPKKGDIVIFNSKPYGHIAIVWSVSGNTLTVFEQNRTGKHDKCSLGKYTTKNVNGYLRHKSLITPDKTKIVEIKCQSLYLRETPSMTGKICGVVKKGERYRVLQTVNTGSMKWAKIGEKKYFSITNKSYYRFV